MRSHSMWAALIAFVAVSVGACGAPAPSASGSALASAADEIGELTDGAGPLPPGRYAPSASRPPVTFAVSDGWSGGPVRDGDLAISHPLADGAVVELRITSIDGVLDAAESVSKPADATTTAQRLEDRGDVEVSASSPSRMSGLEGHNLELGNQTAARLDLFTADGDRLGIQPGGRLWLSLFDTPGGVLAIAVSSPAVAWDEALATVEPVLESVTIDGG